MSIMASARFDAEVLALPDVPVVARRLAVSGSNVQIGRAVTELAIARYGMRPEDLLGDGRYVRARRTYFRRNYPIHLRRMRGVAGAFGLHPDDDRFDFSILRSKRRPAVPSNLNADSTYTPPAASETGSGTLSRWADLQNKVEDQLELYIMEWRSVGASIASVAVHVDDLLSGTIAGINATGLAVSAVGTGSTGNGAADRPTRLGGVQTVGLHELQLMRLVLDTCRSVDDAQAALLAAR
ncbi:MAG TPA: hypothetical protein VIV06_02905, partial [Candidatus Limnocylindrales bacterium]